MKLIFTAHLSAKTHRFYELKVFPDGEPEDFLTRREDEERGESSATTCEFDFPDHSVVVARIEFGPAVIGPEAPVSVDVEVHIGAEASASVIAAAEAEAKKLVTQAGIEEHNGSIDDSSGPRVIRH